MVSTEVFGVLPQGETVSQYTLANESGLTVKILNYGGIIRELWVPDRNGTRGNVVLSYDTLEDYQTNPAYIGAVIGRTAGRIANGDLVIGDSHYSLDRNNGQNTLHGGAGGFHRKLMTAKVSETPGAMVLDLSFISEAGESGYPGTVSLTLRYTLQRDQNVLTLDFMGSSDQKTYLNLTHHGYFNLAGSDTTIEDQLLQLEADAYAPVDEAMLPWDGWKAVGETPFDLRRMRPLGEIVHREDPQLRLARGIDHPFRLMGGDAAADSYTLCASLQDPKSGRDLKVSTTQPHLVVYTGNFLETAQVPSGKEFRRHQGICFEAQEVPNAPGNPAFQCHYLDKGETYLHSIRYEFG